MTGARDELYVGYLPKAPPALARWLRLRVVALALAFGAVVATLAALQGPFARARFEYGAPTKLRGRIALEPVPHLLVARPDTSEPSRYVLVGQGKHGALERVAQLDGREVTAEGVLIYRSGQTLFELAGMLVHDLPGASMHDDAPAESAPRRPLDLGRLTLAGEIVDSKCFLGVMKPGERKPHRACASLCIRGGVPPVLAVHDTDGGLTTWLLVGTGGEPVNEAVLPFVAEPVRVEGAAWRYGDLYVLRIDPKAIERL